MLEISKDMDYRITHVQISIEQKEASHEESVIGPSADVTASLLVSMHVKIHFPYL